VSEGPNSARPTPGPEVDPTPVHRKDPEHVDRLIDEAEEESFPASDSPSSWSGPPTALG
jgi:hypothetical protein